LPVFKDYALMTSENVPSTFLATSLYSKELRVNNFDSYNSFDEILIKNYLLYKFLAITYL